MEVKASGLNRKKCRKHKNQALSGIDPKWSEVRNLRNVKFSKIILWNMYYGNVSKIIVTIISIEIADGGVIVNKGSWSNGCSKVV